MKRPDAKTGRRGEATNHWKGGRRIATNGYVLVRAPDHPMALRNGYVQEHRLVMANILGRLLEPGEVVHHRNGDKADNRPENLELMAFGAHSSHHMAGTPWSEGKREKLVPMLRALAEGQRGRPLAEATRLKMAEAQRRRREREAATK